VRTHRDPREIAIEATEFLKAQNPHSKAMVRDLQTGETTEVAARKPVISRKASGRTTISAPSGAVLLTQINVQSSALS
jgi:hypothetical protein